MVGKWHLRVAVICALGALALPAMASARTTVVYAGGTAPFQKQVGKLYSGTVDNFLLNRVVINAGDTVDWNGKALAAGFHTVDIPALHGSDLPLILPSGGLVPSTVLDAAGNPFWFDGHLPNLGLDPQLLGTSGGHVYTGSARVESGLPLGRAHDFKVRFPKPGVYEYFCDVHPGMRGVVVVRRHGDKVPSAAQDAARLARAERHYARQLRRLARTRVRGSRVQLGAAASDGAEALAMFPATLHVKAGTTVTFFMSRLTRETHTATFGNRADLKTLANSFIGKTGAISPIGAYPSSPPGTIVLTPSSHGNGFANVGALDRDSTTPLAAAGQIDFTKAGVYHFICLIHPFMRGTVIVK